VLVRGREVLRRAAFTQRLVDPEIDARGDVAELAATLRRCVSGRWITRNHSAAQRTREVLARGRRVVCTRVREHVDALRITGEERQRPLLGAVLDVATRIGLGGRACLGCGGRSTEIAGIIRITARALRRLGARTLAAS
jgi:hypothetical protein